MCFWQLLFEINSLMPVLYFYDDPADEKNADYNSDINPAALTLAKVLMHPLSGSLIVLSKY